MVLLIPKKKGNTMRGYFLLTIFLIGLVGSTVAYSEVTNSSIHVTSPRNSLLHRQNPIPEQPLMVNLTVNTSPVRDGIILPPFQRPTPERPDKSLGSEQPSLSGRREQSPSHSSSLSITEMRIVMGSGRNFDWVTRTYSHRSALSGIKRERFLLSWEAQRNRLVQRNGIPDGMLYSTDK